MDTVVGRHSCWVCLGAEGPITLHCHCLRPAHPQCLVRRQLQCMGHSDGRCPFCAVVFSSSPAEASSEVTPVDFSVSLEESASGTVGQLLDADQLQSRLLDVDEGVDTTELIIGHLPSSGPLSLGCTGLVRGMEYPAVPQGRPSRNMPPHLPLPAFEMIAQQDQQLQLQQQQQPMFTRMRAAQRVQQEQDQQSTMCMVPMQLSASSRVQQVPADGAGLSLEPAAPAVPSLSPLAAPATSGTAQPRCAATPAQPCVVANPATPPQLPPPAPTASLPTTAETAAAESSVAAPAPRRGLDLSRPHIDIGPALATFAAAAAADNGTSKPRPLPRRRAMKRSWRETAPASCLGPAPGGFGASRLCEPLPPRRPPSKRAAAAAGVAAAVAAVRSSSSSPASSPRADMRPAVDIEEVQTVEDLDWNKARVAVQCDGEVLLMSLSEDTNMAWFERQVRQLLKIEDDEEIDMEFSVKAPEGDGRLTFSGIQSFDQACECMATAAAKRLQQGPPE